jgi:hypothetical protein
MKLVSSAGYTRDLGLYLSRLLVLLFLPTPVLLGQNYFGFNRLHEHHMGCEHGLEGTGVDAFTFVAPQENFVPNVQRDVNITVNYTGFPANAQAAFAYAVDIWAAALTSSVTIVVEANYELIPGNTLGFAGAANSFRNFPNAPLSNTFYPAALADKLRGVNNSPGQIDITCTFNSDVNWYFGTDGNTPSGQYDFVTVVLHELCHGLGFFGSATITNGNGFIGFDGSPFIYDTFTEQQNGTLLTTLPNGSTTLASALTNGQLYWGGEEGSNANSGNRPRLYAPGTWAGGSSFSHLNENTYPAGNINSLMTPFLGTAEANHNPGPIVLGMFEDMGWTVGPCGITSITLGNQTACNPVSNTFSQQLIVEYENVPTSGLLNVGGSLFVILSSPQTVTLSNRPANGLPVDVTAFFTADPGCSVTFDDLFVAPEPCCANVRITGVNPSTRDITLTNFGNCTSNISNLELCSNFFCSTVGSLQVIAGSTSLAAGSSATFRWNSWSPNPSGTDLALYTTNPVYTDPADLLDFVQWFSSGNAREPVAVAKGIWTAGDFISGLAPFTFTGGGADYGVSFWQVTIPPCTITAINVLEQGPCNPATNNFTQAVEIQYVTPPPVGQIQVNSQFFNFDPNENAVVVNLVLGSNGSPYNLNVLFSNLPSCNASVSNAFTAPPVCFCPADFNGDGTNDIQDFLFLLSEFGCSGSCTADLNGSGGVGSDDVLFLLVFFGQPCP